MSLLQTVAIIDEWLWPRRQSETGQSEIGELEDRQTSSRSKGLMLLAASRLLPGMPSQQRRGSCLTLAHSARHLEYSAVRNRAAPSRIGYLVQGLLRLARQTPSPCTNADNEHMQRLQALY